MPLVYFNAYNTTEAPEEYQLTGSTATWIDNTDTDQFSAYTGINEFWPSPSAGDDGEQNSQNLIICWADNSVANSTSKGGTAKVSYWSVPYSAEEENYLDWLNEAIRCAGGNPQSTLSLALTEAATSQTGIWTNYNTDITPGLIL